MKILFTDLDDTLLNNQSQVSAETKAFLDEFLAAGNRLVLSSGRPLMSVMEVKELAGLTQPGIFLSASNGTRVYDCDQQRTIRKVSLPLSYISYLQEQAKALSLHIQTYRDCDVDDAVVSPADDEEVRFYRRKVHLPLVVSENLCDALTEEPCKMLAISLHNSGKLETFRRNIADWAEGKVRMIYSSDKYLELFDWNAGKGSSLLFLCDYLGIPVSDSYAAGDADNDISMLDAAGCGIAMQNATDKVKAHADVVTDFDNDQNGLADMMRKLLER
ncbi:MAG: HAD family phosphatase [Lachnospiraceae bacterium]|jgi:Cof subfamily protein (haloacid dehalogenase superfamily)|nr:HAD family phosphatase [Lachnospiraceae bacterium]MCI9396823.1 HAD family phosphatase [Lachnospiraceae bacterium]